MRHRREPLMSTEMILWLQTTCGNRAVQRLLARKAMERAGKQTALVLSDRPEIERQAELTREHRAWWWMFRWILLLRRR